MSSETPEVPETRRPLVVFRLGTEEFAVRADSVAEVVRVPEALEPMPGGPDVVEGLFELHGSWVPAVDVCARLGKRPARTSRRRILVAGIGGVRVGFIVDGVTQLLRIQQSAIQTSEPLRIRNRSVQLLDLHTLLSRDELDAMTARRLLDCA